MKKENQGLVYTNENCIGCNKCISVCSSAGACIAEHVNGKNIIEVDPDKCIACGACFDVCEHNARRYRDDTERFFDALKNDEKISILVAPSFIAKYPDEYASVLGILKAAGVNHIINVSFGADITTWGYINYIKNNNFEGGISQPCPSVVAYIERHIPSLIPKLFPVHSPLICSAIYVRKVMGITDKLAFISPCIGKKLEIDDPNTNGVVTYNVTFKHLMEYIKENNLTGEPCTDEIEYGLGSLYPMPGGLKKNIQWFLGPSAFVRQMDGERRMYRYLEINKERLAGSKSPFMCIDALNCSAGCIAGTGTKDKYSRYSDEMLINLNESSHKNMVSKISSGSAWDINLSYEERLNKLNEQFKDLDPEDYVRHYTDRSDQCHYEIPTEEEEDAIFNSMDKFTYEARHFNCSCCGYDSCKQMVMAIHNGFNRRENCIYYLRNESEKQRQEVEVTKAATEAKTRFLASMSHEIRTPINGLLGMNSLIQRDCTDPTILEYSNNISSAGRGLLNIVNNILDITKIESGKMELVPNEYRLSELIAEAYNMVIKRATDKNLTLRVVNDSTIPNVLYGDESKVRTLFTNLLTNAIKYTGKGSVLLKVSYSKIDDYHISLRIAVKDTGSGISEKDQKSLFDSFTRFDLKHNQNIEGTGLGLYLTKSIVDLMDGQINVKSKLGEGSEFTIDIPQEVISFVKIGRFDDFIKDTSRPSNVSDLANLRTRNARILVVDDNPLNIKVFTGLLKPSGIIIDEATSGKIALRYADINKYDIIYMDHMMPERDGIETMHDIKANMAGINYETPIVVLTANAIAGMREMYLSEGFNDYLSKPMSPDSLLTSLIKFLPTDKIKQ